MHLIHFIANQTQFPESSIKNTVQLLNEDCTIPFIARYRKERTGNLDEVQIGDIVKYKEQFEVLEKRKTTILKALEEQNVLTAELKQKVESAQDITTLEDLYLPFKKSRKTKAETARKNGLEPLAKIIMSQNAKDLESIAFKYLKGDITFVEDALEGARHIIAEWINERTDIRNTIRFQLERFAMISTKVVKVKADDENAQKFRDYFDWEESLNRIPSHRLLAILRAEKEGYIKFKIEIDNEKALSKIEDRVIQSYHNYRNACTEHIKLAIQDAYKRLLLPSLSNEALQKVKEKADESAIHVFAKNLKQLLLGSPIGEKRVLAIDPGFRTGCKVVCLDAQGQLKYNETIYPHPPKSDAIGAMKKLTSLADAYKIEAIAIGNGTASRETEALIRKIRFKNDIQVFVVSEAGASIYSASKIAREEFPDFDVTVRGSVSIGRRLQDPLAELVKIDAKSIGVGQYQHDVDQTKLQKSLDMVVENCVNAVGVNINTASKSLLSYVSGIGPKLAENIFDYRQEHGVFSSRNDIKNVPRLGGKAFEQGAAFLRIKEAKNPLDDSAVHPESYAIVEKMANDLGKNVSNLIGNETLLKKINLQKYCTESVGLLTLQDIVKELEKPGLDIREQAKVFTFNQNIKTINDLREGQLLPGIVNNITNFGCFVDIGIKESGLIHVSNLADTFVSDVNEHVSLHQQIIVKVLEVDIPRKRIQLQLHK
ncbi:MAG: RNA-binding transcriptional accessory protein [Flavobacteriales bacterium]|nr:RNA-binding transcriptional accessory protein [Flavobacteriia bacterium]NCP05820.1 RNA-binding transcriptional accessory protein [Flavobacteriales bacterium]PIV94377.1 MAG: RNA-binding transcriptional accessory protein [Flavobacteriaceae bacterium CG17_big_fil_post_rev_8_21_14_2_50_33_15]PIY09200.1 MAG: RNA-binding transcriptional accessory protein [Flavobacteriaceae bacterium CG_4_10_14_3_um_filter_33_47]PJB19493.1 MAG: RNA-binding transcriptional accessory protein [Flavobacteriaceae bacter